MDDPGAASYQTDSDEPPFWVAARNTTEMAQRLRYDPCLARAAKAYAPYQPADTDQLPPMESVEMILHHHGCPDATAGVTMLYTSSGEIRAILDELNQQLGHRSWSEFTHIGLGRAPSEVQPYEWQWAVFLTRRHFAMARPFPRRLDINQMKILELELDSGFSNPRVLATRPDGSYHEFSVRRSSTGLSAVIYGGAQAGTLSLQVIATGDNGAEVIAGFPVAVGTDPVRRWQGAGVVDRSGLDVEAAAAQMLELLNGERLRMALHPLTLDSELVAIANSHSTDMVRRDFFGHVGPGGPVLMERFMASSYTAVYFGENVAHAGSIAEAHRSLMGSPGHRANILSTEPTEIGIGVIKGPSPGGSEHLFVTQIFARPLEPFDRDRLRDKARKRLETERARAGRSSSARSTALDSIADEIADLVVLEGFDQQRALALARSRILSSGWNPPVLYLHVARIIEIDAFEAPERALESDSAAIGLGIANEPDFNRFTLVFLVADRR